MVGDVLAQTITGTPNLDVFRSVQLGAIGTGLDIFRQDLASNAGGHSERIAKAAKSVSSQAVWGPLVACTFYAALKVVEGQPGEILQGVEVCFLAHQLIDGLHSNLLTLLPDSFQDVRFGLEVSSEERSFIMYTSGSMCGIFECLPAFFLVLAASPGPPAGWDSVASRTLVLGFCSSLLPNHYCSYFSVICRTR